MMNPNILKKVTFRLTLWYVIIFFILMSVVYGIVHVTLRAELNKQTDVLIEKQLFSLTWIENIVVKSDRLDVFIERAKRNFRYFKKMEKNHNVNFALLDSTFTPLISSDTLFFNSITSDRFHIKDAILTDTLMLNTLFDNQEQDSPVKGVKEDDIIVQITTLNVPHLDFDIKLGSRIIDGQYYVLMTVSQKKDAQTISSFRLRFLSVFMIMVLIGGFLGFLVSKRAMAGVERVTQTALKIGKGDLYCRVPIGKEGEEIEILAQTFNEMLERIQTLIKEMKEVTNNIAHDLRSPITRIRGLAETSLSSQTTLDDHINVHGLTIEECDRLAGLINTMLEIAETDSGVVNYQNVQLNLNDILESAFDLFFPLAEEKQIQYAKLITQENITVYGDKSRIQRALANILDNAIKYTLTEGCVWLKMSADQAHVKIIIEDTGIGIEDRDQQRIFDRFFRCDPSRTTNGNGLGLSLAQSVIHAHKGKIHVSSTPGKGSQFTITLPLSRM